MRQVSGTLVGQQGLKLVSMAWLPESKPKAVAVVVHGYGEHMGRYRHVVEALLERDYAVYGLDHRGHGQSEGVRAHVEHFDYFVDDLRLLVRQAQQSQPDLPLVMIGHSMGGLIAARYALRYQSDLAALVLSGAALLPGAVNPLLVKLSGLIARIAPRLPVAPPPVEGLTILSRDPAIIEAFTSDALCYKGKMRARIGYEILQAMGNTLSRARELQVPVLIMHGADDKYTNPQGSVQLHDGASSPDKTLKLWPDCRHEIFNELEKTIIIAYMLDWLDARVPRTVSQQARLQQA
jgi:acylglycerol lipase